MSDNSAPEKSAPSPNSTSANPSTSAHTARTRTSPKQALARLNQQLETMAKRKAALEEKVAAESRAVLVKKGRTIFVSEVEKLHPGERSLVVDSVIEKMDEDKRAAVQAWLMGLAV